jgi:hypothetical protein
MSKLLKMWEINKFLTMRVTVQATRALQHGVDPIFKFLVISPNILSSPRHPDQLCSPPSLLSSEYWRFFPQGVKWLWHEANHSPPASAEVKKTWVYTSTPLYIFMA